MNKFQSPEEWIRDLKSATDLPKGVPVLIVYQEEYQGWGVYFPYISVTGYIRKLEFEDKLYRIIGHTDTDGKFIANV